MKGVIFFAQISISGKCFESSLQGTPAELRGPAEVVGTFEYTQSTFADQTYCWRFHIKGNGRRCGWFGCFGGHLVASRWCWWLAPPCWTTTDPLELEVTWCWTRESSNWRLTFDKGTEADSELKQWWSSGKYLLHFWPIKRSDLQHSQTLVLQIFNLSTIFETSHICRNQE